MSNNNKKAKSESGFEMVLWNFGEALGKTLLLIAKEIGLGISYGTMPVVKILITTLGLFIAFKFGWDKYLWSLFGKAHWYPQKTYGFYFWFFVCSPVWTWGMSQVFARRKLENKMNSIFTTAGLKSHVEGTPKPKFDREIAEGIRSMRVSRSSFPLEQFQKAKPYIESGMGVYVDQFKENRESGTIDIIYSKTPMPKLVSYSGNGDKETDFHVGQTRSNAIFGDLTETPHLLVAGQTGSGKSTFVRGLITSLYKNSDSMEFVLVDLKGGLEFQLFENLKRVKVIPSIERAIKEFKDLQMELERRMKLLREKDAKDLEELRQITGEDGLHRKLIVIDEAAEIFLSGHHATSGELGLARKAISQIARQGRAVGVHLVMATQRPDAKAIDPQVKTNLTGIICFQMPNNISSMTVLDSGRATHLSDIPGRAIWKNGGKMTELQTPYLSIEKAKGLLSSYKVKTAPSPKKKAQGLKNFDLEV
ncbi:MAG: DNA translocase FtsK [Bdellovibrionaceae bacterium]|nr:DNA translocase FtsK [Pseudobdellovibrionaceae bacterium]MCB9093229.1 DNA translocase FtsK [Halobacteriovoraceae bacterium]